MPNQLIQAGAWSIIGDRNIQQDSMRFMYRNDVVLAAVCDGMGGMLGGELASSQAIQCIFERFQNNEPAEEMYAQWLYETFGEADRIVHGLTDKDGNPLGGGSTAVTVIIKGNRAYWGSVGDSRIYYLNSKGLFTVNRAHNYNMRIDEMLKNNEMTPEQAQVERRQQGESLISFLGMGDLAIIDVISQPIIMQSGDQMILCSDGVYKSLNDQQIRAITEESGGNTEIAAQRLCNDAYRLANAKQDNTTAVVLRCT